MRGWSAFLSASLFSAGLAACSGGSGGFHCLAGDPHCHDPLRTDYGLRTVPFGYTPPPSPIPVGASLDVTFQEQKCTGNGSQSGPPPGSGCSSWYTPAVLFGRVAAISNSNAPCPVTVTQTTTGTLRFTRTGPGDPNLGSYVSSARGYCSIEVLTPEAAAAGDPGYGIEL